MKFFQTMRNNLFLCCFFNLFFWTQISIIFGFLIFIEINPIFLFSFIINITLNINWRLRRDRFIGFFIMDFVIVAKAFFLVLVLFLREIVSFANQRVILVV